MSIKSSDFKHPDDMARLIWQICMYRIFEYNHEFSCSCSTLFHFEYNWIVYNMRLYLIYSIKNVYTKKKKRQRTGRADNFDSHAILSGQTHLFDALHIMFDWMNFLICPSYMGMRLVMLTHREESMNTSSTIRICKKWDGISCWDRHCWDTSGSLTNNHENELGIPKLIKL